MNARARIRGPPTPVSPLKHQFSPGLPSQLTSETGELCAQHEGQQEARVNAGDVSSPR